ncbi:MAG: SPOR domain-containing protein [Rhodospirillales bacterium]|nr:MAG: SPOR domain-containing protein [Rhodospirillales bacterium]
MVIWLGSGDGDSRLQDGNLPVIRADGAPVKVRPEDPGGMVVAHRDKLVYRRLGDDADELPVERLLPEPEEPLPPPAPQPPPPLVTLPDRPAGDEDGDPFGEGLSIPADQWDDAGELSGDDSLGVMDPPSPPPADTLPPTPRRLSPEAEAAQALLMPSGGGQHRIQLASVRTRADAEAEWRRLSRRHSDLLGHLSPEYSSADVGDRGVFYRLRAGPVGDEGAARRLCDALAGRNVGCLVVGGGG